MKKKSSKIGKREILYITAALLGVFLVFQFIGKKFDNSSHLTYSDFMSQIDKGQVQEVMLVGRNIEGYTNDGRYFSSYMPLGAEGMVEHMREKGIKIDVEEPSRGSLLSILISLSPMLIIMGLWLFSMRSMNKGGGPLGFGKSKAKELQESKTPVFFDDVGGVNEARDQVKEIVDFLSNPKKFGKLGGKIPRGCLLVGPPGTGKTLLAKAVAGEAGVPFFSVSGSEFVEMFVGVGASRVRDMFNTARSKAPCLLFIDEIDAVAKQRGGVAGMSQNDEREQTLNQLLVEMDGITPTQGIIIIAATNRQDVLDKALLRPGRFDRIVHVGLPDINGREEVLNIHVKGKSVPIEDEVDLRVLARGTTGFSGADLANLVNEAALMAARNDEKGIKMYHLEEARDKILMGVERRSMKLSDQDKKLIAYHEAGHALVALKSKHAEPVHKATIVPRGQALGLVMQLPEKDAFSMPLDKLFASMDVAMGGRAAEEIILGKGKVTTGAMSDIQSATRTAKNMVTQWGLSSKLGPIHYGDNSDNPFASKEISEETAKIIDGEIRSLVNDAHKRATKVIKTHKKDLEKIANALLKYETLLGSELKDLLAGKKINPESVKKKKAVKKSKKNDDDSLAGGLVPVTAAFDKDS